MLGRLNRWRFQLYLENRIRIFYHERDLNILGKEPAKPIRWQEFILSVKKCDRPISEKYKTQMISQKQWRATAKPQNPGHIGFQLSRFYSPWVRWTDIALNYEAARHDPQQLQVFWNATLGLPYEKVAGEKLDWERLRDQAKPGTA